MELYILCILRNFNIKLNVPQWQSKARQVQIKKVDQFIYC